MIEQPAEWCSAGVLERPLYYPRQLITPTDLNLGLAYARDMMRRHNRMMHGWGVVCGGAVCAVTNADGSPQPWKISIQPGYLLGPNGDEIIIHRRREFDLRHGNVSGCAEDTAAEMVDPWCTPARMKKVEGKVHIAVRYKEVATHPVQVQPAACGCNDTPCENSRLCDGYEFGVLKRCPVVGKGASTLEEVFVEMFGSIQSCPECKDEGWVTLATVTVDANGGIQEIDNCSCRRMVATLAGVWKSCSTVPLKVERMENGVINQNSHSEITLVGSGLTRDTWVDWGNGIEPRSTRYTMDGTRLTYMVEVSPFAPEGERTIYIHGVCDEMVEEKITIMAAL